MSADLTTIPASMLRQARQHLTRLQTFNAGIARMRTFEAHVGSAGRYEYEFRRAREAEAQQSAAWLDRFAAQARGHSIDPEAVWDALGGRPRLEPWSEAAQAWSRS